MRFAVLSEIQANLSALEAILQDIDDAEREVDRIFCAGDLVGRGPHPNEVMELCRTRGIDSVLGNYDDAVAFDRLGSGADFATVRAEQDDARAVAWTKRALTNDNMEALRRLPRDLRLFTAGMGAEIKRNTGNVRAADSQRTFRSRFTLGTFLSERRPPGPKRIQEVLLVHGTPRALNEFLREDCANSIMYRVVRDARADVIITGHSAMAYRRDFDGCVIVGAGSLAGAHARPGRADYVILDVNRGLDVEFRSVEFDTAHHDRAMSAHDLPKYAIPAWPL